MLPDLLQRVRRRDELRAPRSVDTVEAWRVRRRTADSHVHFAGTCTANHLHDLSTRRPADDRVVHENDTPAFENAANGVQLDAHAEVPDRLLWLDEGAAHVVIPNQSHPHRNAGRLGVSHRGTHAGIGNRHDDIRLDRALARQPSSELGAGLIDALAEHVAVGTREIDVLEDALRLSR